ncbi:MAG TPA: hypothetical protein VEF04_01675, partial [Blastocatellia bacterium]|nr:hypothetical protein [Blastocatellia bacterium]
MAEPIPADKYPSLFKWAEQISNSKIDPSAKDSSRMFYTPAKASEQAGYVHFIGEGSFLDWRKLDLQAECEETKPTKPTSPRLNNDERVSRYVQAAIDSEVSKVIGASNGSRNNTLNIAAYSLGRFVGAGLASEDEIASLLERAAIGAGLSLEESRGTIRSGLRAGSLEPANIPEPKTKQSSKRASGNAASTEAGDVEIEDEEKEPRQSKASLLIELAQDIELFHNAEGKTFATINVNGHRETYLLKSSHLKRYLAARFYAEHKSTIHPPAMQEALLTLEGRAAYEGQQREVYTRVAYLDGHLYIDLCNETWQVVEVSKTGWKIVSDCPVRFRRASGMLALPTPVQGGKVESLRRHLNLEGEEYDSQWTLIAAWLVQSLRWRGPYPVLCLHGEQGSGKSTAARMLRSLFDPNTA